MDHLRTIVSDVRQHIVARQHQRVGRSRPPGIDQFESFLRFYLQPQFRTDVIVRSGKLPQDILEFRHVPGVLDERKHELPYSELYPGIDEFEVLS